MKVFSLRVISNSYKDSLFIIENSWKEFSMAEGRLFRTVYPSHVKQMILTKTDNSKPKFSMALLLDDIIYKNYQHDH